MLHIEYQLSEDDFVAAWKLAAHKRHPYAPLWIYGIPIAGAVLMLYTVGNAVVHRELASLNTTTFGLALTMLLLPFVIVHGVRKLYRKSTALQLPRCIEFSDLELHIISPNSDSRMSWNTYSAFSEDENAFILFQQTNAIFSPFPKRQLSSSQIDELRAILTAHLPLK